MNGILLIDKPAGWTSHDVVAKLRGILRERRIGHSGTLDPMATGLLVVFVGRATKAVEFAELSDKEYIAGLRLGTVTDTMDITGTVLDKREVRVTREELLSAIESFRGEISQLPPMYSAVKVNGKKLYELARKGREAERKPRRVTVSRLEIMGESCGDCLLSVKCSKGTYIRSLCNDIGEKLGCGGAMFSLRRTSAGIFNVDDAVSIEAVEKAAEAGAAAGLLIPTDRLFAGLPALYIGESEERKCRVGAAFRFLADEGKYRVFSQGNGEFLMLGEARGGTVFSIKNFF